MQIREVVRSHQKSVKPEVAKELMNKMRKEHAKMVKGRFEFLDAQGGWIEFNYRIFPEDLLVAYKFVHGETCEIPMGLVKHLNNTTKKVRKPVGNFRREEGGELARTGAFPTALELVSRVRFTPVDVL